MKMIQVEGYKAFHGKMKITPKDKYVAPFTLEGDWIYRPDTGCWYGCCRSFCTEICEPIETE